MPQFVCLTQFYSSHTSRDLSRYKFVAATRAFVIKEDSAAAEHSISLAVVPG